jgi:ABC-2 type transport system ATP-binding protein
LIPVIASKGLTKNFGSLCAVSDLNLSVMPGETLCLLGPNGAGKSTAINLMLGLTRPSAGSIRVLGHAPDARAARRAVGYVAQDSDFPPNLTVLEILELVRCHYPDPLQLDELIGSFGLETLTDRQTGGFSGGQRRRLSLALAFAGRGRIVFLDEPTTGLDGTSRRNFWIYAAAYVKSGGTLLLTTHHLEEIETMADRICLIDHGQIRLEGTVEHIRSRIAQKHISFACDELPDLTPVLDVVKEGGIYRIVSPDSDEVVRQLVTSGVAFSNLEIRSASLEEAIDHLAPDARGDAA